MSIIHPDVEAKIRERALADGVTVDAYLERLMREEDAEIAHTERLLQEAADSGDYVELTDEEWDRMEQDALAEARSKSKRRA